MWNLYKKIVEVLSIDHSVAQGTLFEMLVCVALDDKDDEVRLAAADALRCLPEADPDSCDSTCIGPQLQGSHQGKPCLDGERIERIPEVIEELKMINCEW